MNKYDVVESGKEVEIKAFSITIEPMYIGKGKDKRTENVVSVRVFNDAEKGYELQGIVAPKSRLDLEVRKLLKLCEEGVEKGKKA
jgi:hypothetical protein